VGEAGLFVSRDRGENWQPIDGFNEHPSDWGWHGEWGRTARVAGWASD
jgi:hypothetical protein